MTSAGWDLSSGEIFDGTAAVVSCGRISTCKRRGEIETGYIRHGQVWQRSGGSNRGPWSRFDLKICGVSMQTGWEM